MREPLVAQFIKFLHRDLCIHTFFSDRSVCFSSNRSNKLELYLPLLLMDLQFWKYSIIWRASEKTSAISLLADRPPSAFVGADSSGKTHYRDFCLVSMSCGEFIFRRRSWNLFELRLNNLKHSFEFVIPLMLKSRINGDFFYGYPI